VTIIILVIEVLSLLPEGARLVRGTWPSMKKVFVRPTPQNIIGEGKLTGAAAQICGSGAPIYEAFSEGLNTRDLRRATSLLGTAGEPTSTSTTP
jgi:hypothetical protein